jgi:two-component system response regulator AtoC
MKKPILTILVAEDEDSIRRILSRIFQKKGFKVVSARDGREAYRLYQREKPDLLLSDINMPDMTGLELLGMIREKDKELPTIFVSGQWFEGMDSVTDPHVEFLPKPVDWLLLQDRVQNALVS